MKTLTKFIALALALLCVVTTASCGNNTTVDYDHTIVFYSTQADKLQKITQTAIDAFEAAYPGWTVKHEQPGGYDEVKAKVVSDLQGGVQPDLVYCYADHVALYLQTSKVVDLSQFLTTSETTIHVEGKDAEGKDAWVEKNVTVGYTAAEIADFVEGYYNEGKATNYAGYDEYGYSDSAMFTLPFVKSTELLYYNKTALKACKLDVATTWDELWAQCATLKAKYPKATPLGYDSESNWFITMCEQNNWGYTRASGNKYLFNNENTVAWLEKLAEYYEDGYITTQNEYGAYTSNLFTKGAEDGGVIYCIGSSGGASYQASDLFEWGVAAIPGSKQADGSINSAVISQGPNFCMLYSDKAEDKTEKATMTFLFMQYLLAPTFQAAFSDASGYNPSRLSTYEIDSFAEILQEAKITAVAANVAKDMTPNYFTSPAFVGSSTARTQVGNALVFAMTGQKTAEKALKDAYSNCGGK